MSVLEPKPRPAASGQLRASLRPARRLAVLLASLVAALAAAGPLSAGADAAKPPDLDARAWTLVDARDGERLAGRAASRPLPIASATKLMTAYLALRDLELDEMVSAPGYDALPAESVLGLREGETLSVKDLLTALLLPSANDAAVALATEVSGSVPRFVVRMNGAARKLGLDDTSFANPIGLDDPANLSSARDLAALTLELRQDPRFRKIVARPEAVLRSGGEPQRVSSRNTLLGADRTVNGVKTGHTRGAGYVLVASARRKGVPLVSVVLGAGSEAARDAESARLLDYGFSLYEPRWVVRAEQQAGAVAVSHEDEPLELLAARGERVTARRDQSLDLVLEVPGEVEGPIAAGDRVGRGVVTLEGEQVAAVPLLAAREVAAPGPLEEVGGPLAVVLILAGSMLVVAAFAVAVRRGRPAPVQSVRTPEERANSERRPSRSRQKEGERT